jgi:type I restriction enzyme S subunit
VAKDDIRCGPFGTQLAKAEYRDHGVPLWGIKHVNAAFGLATSEFLEPGTASRLVHYSVEPGDIVMTRKGTVGNCAVYPDGHPVGIMHSDLLRLRLDRANWEPVFVAHQLHHSRDVEQQLSLISGGAVMPGINVSKLKGLTIQAPPFDMQRQFSRRVAAIEELKSTHGISLAAFDALFASLQHRAFRGES